MEDAFSIWFWRPMFEFLGTIALFVAFVLAWLIGYWVYYNVAKPVYSWFKKRKEN